MPAYVEVWKSSGVEVVSLDADRLAVGKATTNDICLVSDDMVSKLHAALERYPSGWCIRDLGSTNGTFVNGERLFGEHRLRDDDQIRVGNTRLVFREGEPAEPFTPTRGAPAHPTLTRREQEVLVELCRPVLTGEVFIDPASIREIADALVVSEGAVKQHLLRLSEKFGITERGERRRVRLANEAIRRGAVALGDLRSMGKGAKADGESQPGGFAGV